MTAKALHLSRLGEELKYQVNGDLIVFGEFKKKNILCEK